MCTRNSAEFTQLQPASFRFSHANFALCVLKFADTKLNARSPRRYFYLRIFVLINFFMVSELIKASVSRSTLDEQSEKRDLLVANAS